MFLGMRTDLTPPAVSKLRENGVRNGVGNMRKLRESLLLLPLFLLEIIR